MAGKEQAWENREEGGERGPFSVSVLLALTLSSQARRNLLGLEVPTFSFSEYVSLKSFT